MPPIVARWRSRASMDITTTTSRGNRRTTLYQLRPDRHGISPSAGTPGIPVEPPFFTQRTREKASADSTLGPSCCNRTRSHGERIYAAVTKAASTVLSAAWTASPPLRRGCPRSTYARSRRRGAVRLKVRRRRNLMTDHRDWVLCQPLLQSKQPVSWRRRSAGFGSQRSSPRAGCGQLDASKPPR